MAENEKEKKPGDAPVTRDELTGLLVPLLTEAYEEIYAIRVRPIEAAVRRLLERLDATEERMLEIERFRPNVRFVGLTTWRDGDGDEWIMALTEDGRFFQYTGRWEELAPVRQLEARDEGGEG